LGPFCFPRPRDPSAPRRPISALAPPSLEWGERRQVVPTCLPLIPLDAHARICSARTACPRANGLGARSSAHEPRPHADLCHWFMGPARQTSPSASRARTRPCSRRRMGPTVQWRAPRSLSLTLTRGARSSDSSPPS
jgi:hypothetical protein